MSKSIIEDVSSSDSNSLGMQFGESPPDVLRSMTISSEQNGSWTFSSFFPSEAGGGGRSVEKLGGSIDKEFSFPMATQKHFFRKRHENSRPIYNASLKSTKKYPKIQLNRADFRGGKIIENSRSTR